MTGLRAWLTVVFVLAFGSGGMAQQPDAPESTLRERLDALNARIAAQADDERAYSARGDVRFFLADYPGAVADYSKMVELNPEVDTSHWRRGIAYYYAGKPAEAAAQFERYHAFDNVDRENGIWRYLSMYRAQGKEAARKELLRYDKDDREPFGDVYRLFSGEMTPERILQRIRDAEISDDERDKRLFYAELYIGLNEKVEGRPQGAVPHLEQAVANTWPRTAGYGPHYMWQVARLQLSELRQEAEGKVVE